MKDDKWFENHHKFLYSNTRGFGYWIWKPYLIWQTLNNTPPNEYVLYLDAGYEINPKGKERFEQYLELADSNYVVAWQLVDCPTMYWTKAEVLRYFGITNQSLILELPQRESSFHLVKNTRETRAFYRNFSVICCDRNYSLVDDTPSINEEHISFREHRHDQAIFSLLTYEQGIGTFPSAESFFPVEWESGFHPEKYPLAAIRNKSGASQLISNKEVKKWCPAIFRELESNISAGLQWGDNIK
jgi:hypothetical protein